MIRWHVVRTGPQHEFRAVTALKRAGAVAFVPIEVKWLKRRGGRVKRNVPMLVRYAFVGCEDIRGLWGMLREDPDIYPKIMQGVLGLNRTTPYALSEGEISYLASLSEKPVPYVHSINPHKATLAVREGQTARIVEGSLAGRHGKVSKIVGKKAQFITDLFNGLVTVEISLEQLEAVG